MILSPHHPGNFCLITLKFEFWRSISMTEQIWWGNNRSSIVAQSGAPGTMPGIEFDQFIALAV